MQSGLFFVGRDGLSIEGFERFVKPVIEEKGYSVEGGPALLDDKDKGVLLIALSGDGDLREGLRQALEEAGIKNDAHNAEERERYGDNIAPGSYFLDKCTAAIYFPDHLSARNAFDSFVNDYLALRARKASKEAQVILRDNTQVVEDLEKRLAKIAESTRHFTKY